MNLRFSFPTKWNRGSSYSSKRVYRIRANTGHSVMNFTVKDKFEVNLSPWTCSVCRTLIISTISSATPRGRFFFFLLFLSPSSPVCFYPCKMLVALLKYCSALSALFFLSLAPLPLFFLPLYPPPPPILVVVVVEDSVVCVWGGGECNG